MAQFGTGAPSDVERELFGAFRDRFSVASVGSAVARWVRSRKDNSPSNIFEAEDSAMPSHEES